MASTWEGIEDKPSEVPGNRLSPRSLKSIRPGNEAVGFENEAVHFRNEAVRFSHFNGFNRALHGV